MTPPLPERKLTASEIRLKTLEPMFWAVVIALLAELKATTDMEWVCVAGRRTIAEQNALFAQGRTAPGKVVTRARGGQSAHNFGLAADIAPLKNGEVWWEAPRSYWQGMADTAQRLGLVAGFYFHSIFDPDHVESPDWKKTQAKWQAGEITVA